MDELISTLVPPKQQVSAQRLLDDPGSRNLIRQQLSQMAEDNAGLLPQTSFSWILCKLSTFGAEETDTLRIYQAFLSQLNQLGQFCRILSGDGRQPDHNRPRPVPRTGGAAASAPGRAFAAILPADGRELLCGDGLQNHRHPIAGVAGIPEVQLRAAKTITAPCVIYG